MSIWTYNSNVQSKAAITKAISLLHCAFCGARLVQLASADLEKVVPAYSNADRDDRIARCCDVCGWWTVSRTYDHTAGSDERGLHGVRTKAQLGAAGCLKNFDASDQSVPIAEIRAYLSAKYDVRFNIDPSVFERVVASVYEDCGYKSRVTGRSGDEGIDIILDGPDNSLIGVQVKRYKGAIQVEQLRSLTGSLFLQGITRGIFVTTSGFTRGADDVVQKSALRGIAVELVDARRFYEAMGIAQRNAYRDRNDPTAPFRDVKLQTLFASRKTNL
jgi:restriction system protein